jgi:calcium-binding protein CML
LNFFFSLVFSLYDDRGDNHIPKHYLGEGLRALGLNPTEAEIRSLLADLCRVERLSIQQFQVIYERLNRQKDYVIPAEEFIDGLRVFDKDGNGLIRHLLTTLGMKVQVEFLIQLIYYLGERLTDDEVEQLISEFEDKKGMIRYEDFVKAVLQH